MVSWVEMLDPASNKPYYYNQRTGQTSWTRPGGASAEGGGDSAAQASS